MSSKTYLKASIAFLDPTLEGVSLADVSRSYRPLLRVEGNQLTSCFFEKIGDGAGALKLHAPYEVLISLHMCSQMEEFFGKSIGEIFPVGRPLEITTVDRVVARGQAEGILEGEGE